MSYIAIDKNNAKETTTNILVVEVQDTDELIDRNNVEYIKNVNLLNVSLNGSYEPITDGDAAEVNDMLQYWGAIHMFGEEPIISTTDLGIQKSNIKIMETMNLINANMNGIAAQTDLEEREATYEVLANRIMGE